jgi:hypothetical protein
VQPLLGWRELFAGSIPARRICTAAQAAETDISSAIIALMQRFAVTIEGVGWTDVQVLELPRLPREGELIETKYGTCLVTHSESTADTEPFAGKVVCANS